MGTHMRTADLRRFSLAIAILTLAACTPHGPFRTGKVLPPGFPVQDTRIIEDHGAYQLGSVEFGEDGKRLSGREQLNLVVQRLRERRHLNLQTGAKQQDTIGGLTVIYAHGWKNNAQSIEGRRRDVEKFREFLASLAEDVNPGSGESKLPVTGVYLGWRGRSVEIESSLLNWWTLWPRYFVAGRVGSDPMHDSIAQLIQAAVAVRKQLSEERRPRVILIGHSLGGRVLQYALEKAHDQETLAIEGDPKRGLILGQCTALNNGQPVTSVVDLTLLVNEATKSRHARRATTMCAPTGDAMVRHPAFDKDFCKSNPAERRCQPYPLFVHVASSADWATRFLFPVALLGRTAPHTSSLWTHRVALDVPGSTPPPLFRFETQQEPSRTYAVTHDPQNSSKNPVWIMRVDGHVIKDHGDVWNENFQNMIKGFMGGLDVVKLRSFSVTGRIEKKK
jgi:pimeloyl-ACP methyl ester carboxylesterase